MTLRNRIILIVIGVIVFLLMAPTVILYARGYYFDFSHFRFFKSGILSIKTEPKGAEIILNGEKTKTTPAALRFLRPGEYEIELLKENYRPWKKKVTVLEHSVVNLPSGQDEKIFLLPQTVVQTTISTSTKEIYWDSAGLIFADEKGLSRFLRANREKVLLSTTTTDLLAPKIVDSRAGEFLIQNGSNFWYIDQNRSFQLPQNLKKPSLGPGGAEIFALTLEHNLVSIIANKVTSPKILKKGVRDFAFVAGNFYIISENKLLQMSSSGRENIILENLPNFTNSGIVATEQGKIYLLLDSALYEIENTLKRLNSPVAYANWDETSKTLIYASRHEIWTHEPFTNRSQLIIRSSKELGMPAFSEKIGYVFVSEGKEIKAVEIDPLSQPNIYTLTETQSPVEKLYINSDTAHLFFLDGRNLYSIKFR